MIPENDINFNFGGMGINFSDFSAEINIDASFESRYIKPPKAKEIAEINLTYDKAALLAKEIEINQQSRYFFILNGSFYFGDFIEALVVEKGYKVKKMTISTLSMNENNVDSLANLLNWGLLDELNLIVSDHFFSHERHNLIPYIYKELDKNDKFQLAAAGSHCKICIFETYCGKFIIMHGSANLRTSANIEQLVIEESENFHRYYLSVQLIHGSIDKVITGTSPS